MSSMAQIEFYAWKVKPILVHTWISSEESYENSCTFLSEAAACVEWLSEAPAFDALEFGLSEAADCDPGQDLELKLSKAADCDSDLGLELDFPEALRDPDLSVVGKSGFCQTEIDKLHTNIQEATFEGKDRWIFTTCALMSLSSGKGSCIELTNSEFLARLDWSSIVGFFF